MFLLLFDISKLYNKTTKISYKIMIILTFKIFTEGDIFTEISKLPEECLWPFWNIRKNIIYL